MFVCICTGSLVDSQVPVTVFPRVGMAGLPRENKWVFNFLINRYYVLKRIHWVGVQTGACFLLEFSC